MGQFSAWHWVIVAVVVLLLFGSNKLPQMARSMGQGLRIFKAETRAMTQSDEQGESRSNSSASSTSSSSENSAIRGSSPSYGAQAYDSRASGSQAAGSQSYGSSSS